MPNKKLVCLVVSVMAIGLLVPWSCRAFCSNKIATQSTISAFRKTKQCSFCDLSEVNFQNANLQGADLRKAILIDTNFSNTNLTKANLNEAEFTRYGSPLSFCKSEHSTIFSKANLTQVQMRRVMGRGFNFSSTDLTEADLRNSHFSESNFQNALLRSANLSGGSLENSNLQKAQLVATNLSNVSLTNLDLSSANLKGANLRGARLVGVLLQGANLENADLRNTDLKGIIYNYRLRQKVSGELKPYQQPNWSGAIYNEKTIFPEDLELHMKRKMLFKSSKSRTKSGF